MSKINDNDIKLDSLFQKTNSCMFQFLAAYWNCLLKSNGTPPTRMEIINALPYHGSAHKNQSEHIVNAAFIFQKEGTIPDKERVDTAAIKGFGKIPFRFSTLELRWLKTFLSSPEASFLLSERLKSKLITALPDIHSFDFSSCQIMQLSGDDLTNQQNIKALRLLCQSLREHLPIEIQGVHFIPVRLCYDEFRRRYSAIIFEPANKQFQRLSLGNLQELNVMSSFENEATWQQAVKDYDSYCQAHRVSIRLRLKDLRNARERCYNLFSAFDKISDNPQDDIYYLKIFFYDFDKEDIIERILSLGSTVIVERNEKNDEKDSVPSISSEIRLEVFKRLEQARQYYK